MVRRVRAAIETAADFDGGALAEAGCLMLGGATERTFLSNGYEWSWIVATELIPDADPIPDVHTTPNT
ncbi:MAG: hypothetical protein U0794_08390 [Isosphaeraceae bacterium]